MYRRRGTWPTRPACCTEKRLCRDGSVPIGHPAVADSKSTENTRRRAGYCVSGLVSWRAAICRRVHRQHVPGYIAEDHSPRHSIRETRALGCHTWSRTHCASPSPASPPSTASHHHLHYYLALIRGAIDFATRTSPPARSSARQALHPGRSSAPDCANQLPRRRYHQRGIVAGGL